MTKYVIPPHVGRNPLSLTFEEYMAALKVTKYKSIYQKKYNKLMKGKLD